MVPPPRRVARALIFFAALVIWIGLLPPHPPAKGAGPKVPPQAIALFEYARGIPEPTDIAATGVPGDNRLFVTARNGWVYLVREQGETAPEVILDIDDRVIKQWFEQGMLGIVFDPDFATNGYVYLNYTFFAPLGDDRRGDTHISRFQMDAADPDLIDPDSEVVLLTIDQPQENHNGGGMAFGPDGYLYIGSGDGEGGGDPDDNAQNKSLLLGKIIRIDPSAGLGGPPDCIGVGSGGYSVPLGNPFADGPGGSCDEIWAYGLRNPWRVHFDRQTGDLFIGDVGDGNWEEIDYQPASSPGGENYGWACYEGTHEFRPGCSLPSSTFPVLEYPHDELSEAVVGGFVYRGSDYPELAGIYFLADFSGELRSLVFDGAVWQAESQGKYATGFSTFGEDVDGELYLADFFGGVIYRLAYAPLKTYLPIVTGPPGDAKPPAPRPDLFPPFD
ncbi:MAG TPA: PQQ-dependent sugar dehydrogenase [Anaerolineales bacterium]|nr:PQQ-dependent sugar dehydrogenase [Anaerolineales bacterium]